MNESNYISSFRFGFVLRSKAQLMVCGIFLVILAASGLGCNSKETPKDEEAEQTTYQIPTLKMLVIGDEGLGQRVARQWSARRDGTLEIVNQSIDAFSKNDFEIGEEIDIVVYPPALMGELTSRDRLLELPKDVWESDGINKVELLRHYRVSIARRGNLSQAVPLGGPNYSLMYHRAILERNNLDPPETWDRLDRDLERVGLWLGSDDAGSYKSLTAKVDMPLAEGWAANTFLACVAPSVCHRGKLSIVFNRRTLEPLINSQPFLDSLESLKTISSPRSLELDPAGVFELAMSGQSTMALGWPTRSETNEESDEGGGADEPGDAETDVIGIASLPGSDQWFDQQNGVWIKRSGSDDPRVDLIGFSGLVASVSASCRNETTAFEFIDWLPSKTISLLTLVESPTVGPFRASHLGDVGRWTGDSVSISVIDQYADVVAANHQRSLTLLFPRIPGNQQYLKALDSAVRACVSGEKSAKAALDEVAQEWNSITESLGRDKLIREFKMESGL